MLSLLGYFSTSTSVNIAPYFAVGLIVFFIFSVFRAVVKFLSIFNKLHRCTDYIEENVNGLLLMKFVFRYLLLGWLYICISSIYEIHHISEKHVNILVISFPIIILLFWIFFVIFVFWCSIWIKNRQNALNKIVIGIIDTSETDNENNQEHFGNNRCAVKLYPTFFLIHRILIILSLAVTSEIAVFKIWGSAFIQATYIIWLILARPFNELFYNLLKIYKEICILCLLFILLGFHEGSEEVSYEKNQITRLA